MLIGTHEMKRVDYDFAVVVTTISTRRFCARESGSIPVTRGFDFPNPAATSRALAMLLALQDIPNDRVRTLLGKALVEFVVADIIRMSFDSNRCLR